MKVSNNVQTIRRTDTTFEFMKNRGSPAYWNTVLLDLLAMVRQLGIHTWFLTPSAADMQWPEVKCIAHRYGKHDSWWHQENHVGRKEDSDLMQLVLSMQKHALSDMQKEDPHITPMLKLLCTWVNGWWSRLWASHKNKIRSLQKSKKYCCLQDALTATKEGQLKSGVCQHSAPR